MLCCAVQCFVVLAILGGAVCVGSLAGKDSQASQLYWIGSVLGLGFDGYGAGRGYDQDNQSQLDRDFKHHETKPTEGSLSLT